MRAELTMIALGLAAAAQAAAQDVPGPLVTDRPDQTESAVTVPPGLVQIESGLGFAQDTEGSIRVRMVEAPATLIRVGIVDRLEGRFGFAGWQRVEVRTPVSEQSVDGVGDIELGIKLRILEERGRTPQFALIVSTSVPTGDSDIGSERAEPAVLLSLSHTLFDGVSLGYNVGSQFTAVPSTTDGLDTRIDALYTLAFGFALSEGVGAFVEAFGALGLQNAPDDQVSLDGGFTFPLLDNLQFDVSGGVGLSDAADDWFVGAGVSVRVPR